MEFEFSLGGYFNSDNYTIRLAENSLCITKYQFEPFPESEIQIPILNNENWQYLLAFIKTRRWKRRYDSGALDGTQWELKVKDNGFKLKSYGSNAYPDNFNEFIQLLNQVISPAGITIQN